MLRRRIDRGLNVRVDPEDIYQEACLAAQRRWQDYVVSPQADPYVWLYGLVRDQLLLHWRNATRIRRDVRRDHAWPADSAEQLAQGLLAHGVGPRTAFAREELKQLLQRALELLPDDDYEIIKARHFDELSYKQIGHVMGITANTATVRYVRAIKRLRAIWDAVVGEPE